MKILFAGGGTLGPVTPLLAVADELKRKQPKAECVFVGTSTGPERRLVEEAGIRFLALDAPKLRRYFDVRTLFAPFLLLGAVWRAGRLLAAERPDLVVGAGGYVQVPLGLAAKARGIKVLVHQQDVVASLSNKLLAPLADAVTAAFDISSKDFPKKKTSVIGNPVRRSIEEGDRAKGLATLGFSGERPLVLVLGGGTGSAFLNEKITDALPHLTGFADVAHLTGLEKSLPARNIEHPERYRQIEFLGTDMAHALAAADSVVCRAGLGTLTECAALEKAVILVPIADSHQEKNAEFIVERGGARMLHERDVTPESLTNAIRDLLKHPDGARRLGTMLHTLFQPHAREALAEKILSLLS
ncbi:MAG: UDP-N-acetylglucosamine--N-acetylmuramyl-(pentapeptide) pyrophosphoryl-undecaprenol N-acetylglucosamine transferase [Patescibacteria group bacterium]|nr:MAG: UDP-N-acetylglucosamine--N-acetylmuramyl-(pentapeptide) pyrophosphoryl-undecaprenol N-acetylglucosamine transferase [Patescibacteria group bacterium]